MNKLQILGTITKEIETKYTASGAAIVSFSIAYNERYKDKTGQQVDKAMFFDVTAFGKQGEVVAQYFNKGSRILIDGSLDFQSWKAQDGTNRSKVAIKLNGFDFIDKKSDATQSTTQPQQQYTHAQTVPDTQIPLEIQSDEIPFNSGQS